MSLNLLPSEAKFQAQRIRLKGIINNFLWVIGGIWILLILVVFGLIFFMNLRVKQLEKKYQAKQNSYKSMTEEITLSQKIKYQAKVVARVLESRFEYGKSMVLAGKVFPENVKITDIKLNEDRSGFNVTGTVVGKTLDEVEKKIEEVNTGEVEGFGSAKLVSMEVNKNDEWTFDIDLFLKDTMDFNELKNKVVRCMYNKYL